MSNNFFNDDDDGAEFRDIPEEVRGGQTDQPNVKSAPRPAAPIKSPAQILQEQVQANADAAYAEAQEEYAEQSEEEEDFSAVLNDARFRLEQGRLYEMIMNNNIFEGAEGDEKAAKYVMKQIRNFAKEQMEIMLGMRQEKQEIQALSAADFPFNDLEVQTLKALASAATKGATASPAAQQFSGVTQATPQKASFKPIGLQAKPVPKQAAPAPKPAAKPLAQKPQAPVKRQEAPRAQNEQEILSLCMELGISREEYDRQLASFSSALTKPMSQMNEDEVKERNRQIALRTNKQVKNPQAIPMPTAEQEEMLHTQRAQTAASNPQMQVLMAALNNKKK